MKSITVTFTAAEIALLTSLASDQLFRREFIDPRLPGHKANAAEIALCKRLVERLRQMADAAAETASTRQNGTARPKVRVKD